MKIAIIGAGPAGLSCALQLLKKGIEVDLYESQDTVGGLAKSLELWDEKVELGPHFLSATLNPEVKQLLDTVLAERDFCHYKRQTRIVLGNKMMRYPPSPADIVKNIGVINAFSAAFSLFWCLAKLRSPGKYPSFENYIQAHLGDRVYKLFFKGYTEKLWGIPCNEIRAGYATSLIGFGNPGIVSLSKKLLPSKENKKHTHYIYPTGGMSQLWDALLENIRGAGGHVYLQVTIKTIGVAANGEMTIGLPGDHIAAYDYIVSTIPDGQLLQYLTCKASPSVISEIKKRSFRNAILVYIKLSNTDFIHDNNLYLYNNNVQCVRITSYNRFKNAQGAGIIMVEYWVNENDPLWQAGKEQMLQIAGKDLQILFPEKYTILDAALVKLNKAFPVPDIQSVQSGDIIKDHLNQFNKLIRIGRANQNNFNFGMEDALKEGILTANKLAPEAQQ